jgi:hypothetical protein
VKKNLKHGAQQKNKNYSTLESYFTIFSLI